MAASEKLKAFMEDERWRSHDATVLAGLALTMRESALPQLLAVVEAAEQTDTERAPNIVLHAALAALDEALS